MNYPQFLNPGNTIGLCAPSFGVSSSPYEEKFQSAKEKFTSLGYHFKETESLYRLVKARSAGKEQRAKEFMKLYLDPEVDFLFSVAGGELMIEMIPYLDFHQLIHSTPKYFMGYSDNTCLTFLMNTICDTASIYASCFGDYGMQVWDQSLVEGYEVITGKRILQHSYDAYEINNLAHEENNALCSYNKTEPVEWCSLDKKDVTVKGRLLGGCLDVLIPFCGTPYDQVEEFKARYQEDGILWYLEACDLNPIAVIRALWQLKEAGWFDGCKGILLGRPYTRTTVFDISHHEAIRDALQELDVPVIMDMDFGHLPPCFTLISGSVAEVSLQGNKGSIRYELI